MIHWLRWGRPRRLILWVTMRLPHDCWLRNRLGEFLIPDDAVITFLE